MSGNSLLKCFGIAVAFLVGVLVFANLTHSPSSGRVDRKATIRARSSPPYATTKANYASLEIGRHYRLSETTPLMPEFEPADPLAAIGLVKTLPSHSSIAVKQTRMKRTTPWYYVEAFLSDGKRVGEGWINSTALLGQDIEILR